jgi:hypothetical protein
MNAVGISDFSQILTVFTAIVPDVPLNFTIVDSDLGSVTVSWIAPLSDGGSTILGYTVMY